VIRHFSVFLLQGNFAIGPTRNSDVFNHGLSRSCTSLGGVVASSCREGTGSASRTCPTGTQYLQAQRSRADPRDRAGQLFEEGMARHKQEMLCCGRSVVSLGEDGNAVSALLSSYRSSCSCEQNVAAINDFGSPSMMIDQQMMEKRHRG
jgi:hypothetical protein